MPVRESFGEGLVSELLRGDTEMFRSNSETADITGVEMDSARQHGARGARGAGGRGVVGSAGNASVAGRGDFVRRVYH
jgi:hypothetical protein